jgi:Putative zinc-finger
MSDATTCPTARDGDDEVARQWIAGSLPRAAADEFQAHLRTCETCQAAVKNAEHFTDALRAAVTTHRVRQAKVTWLRWAVVAAATAAAATAVFLATNRS